MEEQIIVEGGPEQKNYPSVFDRVKAIVADTACILIFMAIAAYIFSLFENVPDSVRIIVFVFIFFLYDPLFTSIFGGTIGHMMNGIRVKKEKNETQNIVFPLAVIRFLVKASLGLISLLTVHNNKKRKAIHDFIVGSVMVYSKKDLK